eukprot:NODE_441_length_8548_cov_0.413185.p8 type:complete len:108 gc:universal NODE_441_length_8548_cov_0.413185:3349-3672(+)
MAAFIASSASMLQCIFTGGNDNSVAISEFLIFNASFKCLFLIHSVAKLELAIAEPHPNVLNFASVIFPLSSTFICNFMTSPHAGAPTSPVPTPLSFLSNFPTFLGLS